MDKTAELAKTTTFDISVIEFFIYFTHYYLYLLHGHLYFHGYSAPGHSFVPSVTSSFLLLQSPDAPSTLCAP